MCATEREKKKYAAVFKNCSNGSSSDTFLQRISLLYGEWSVLIIEYEISSLQILLLNIDIIKSQRDLLKVNTRLKDLFHVQQIQERDIINNRSYFFLSTYYVLYNIETKKLHTGKCQCTALTGLSSSKLGKYSLYWFLVVFRWWNLIIYGY